MITIDIAIYTYIYAQQTCGHIDIQERIVYGANKVN